MAEPVLRPATAGDAASIGTIWWTGWRDGHVGNVLGDAVALSNRERRWVEVPA